MKGVFLSHVADGGWLEVPSLLKGIHHDFYIGCALQ